MTRDAVDLLPAMIQLVPLHGVGTRGDLPLPFSFVLVGAGLALVVSFTVLLFAWRSPKLVSVKGIALPRLTAVLDSSVVCLGSRLVVLAVYAWFALALVAGPDLLTNPVFGFVFVWMWVGLVPVSLLLGPFWKATNPIRSLHLAVCKISRVDPDQGLVRLPGWVGVWPAALGLFGFAWLELVQPERTTLPVLRVWALVWVVSLMLGAVVFGRTWIAAADPFETFAQAVAQLSPWQRVRGHIRLGNPLGRLTRASPPTGATVVASVLLGSTAFDSFTNTTWWIKTVQGSEVSATVWGTGGLLLMICLVLVSFSVASAWMSRYSSGPATRLGSWPTILSSSLVPIVVGYMVAHYTTLLVVEGQRTAINASDPLGRGWDVFGSAGMGVNSAIFNHPTGIAVLQLCAIVTGHILGVIAAHEKSLQLLPRGAALRSQGPLLVVMVAYTCAGLTLLFSP